MASIEHLCDFLERFAPSELAEDWDNVGLLLGESDRQVSKVMTCLSVTPGSAAEAVEREAGLIVSHHPLPFRPLKRITSETVTGRLLLELIRAEVAVHSPHTGFDSAALGINQQLAEGLALTDIQPLVPAEQGPASIGSGRFGRVAHEATLRSVADQLKQFVGIDRLQVVGPLDRPIRSAAVACGSAGGYLAAARRAGCDLLVTGETNFHTCLEAEATGVALLLPGHYASERFATEQLASVLAEAFKDLTVWPSQRETDPLCWI